LPAFVAGPENRLVAGAIGQLMHATSNASNATPPKPLAPSVLVLFGPSGTGKTHLARGLVRHWHEHCGPATAEYIPAADFRHRFNDAIKRQAELEFRNAIRGHQLLAIDDLQHLPPDDHVLQELRYTLDDYEERGGTVIVTSTQPITALPNLPPDIRSRLAGGLALQLAPPGDAARMRIIRHASHALGRPLSEEAANRLARGMPGTANNLFGAVFELCNTATASGMSDANRAEKLLAARAARRPTLREIVAAVARHQDLPQSQLKSSSRRQSIVFARAIVVFLARELASASYDEIGRALGGRDHTTIIHNYRKIDGQRERDPQTQQTLEHLRRILLSR
jgi:chromosomal replication initiator protein